MTETANLNLQKPEMSDITENAISIYNSNFDIIDNELIKIAEQKSEINNINNLLYRLSEDLIENVNMIENQYFNETQQADAPFTNENYDYVNVTEDSSGCILSDPFSLFNGEYMISSDKRLSSSFMLIVYNPFLGCYEEMEFKQQLKDEKYVADIRIDTSFSKNYARFQFIGSVTAYQKYNLKIYNKVQRYATKEEVNKLLDEIAELKNLLNNK